MSYMLPHLHTGWHVDQAIMSEDDRVVVIRFGRDWDEECMKQDEVLYRIADKCKNFAVFYLVDIDEVADFNKMYELYDACTVMFFFRNKHMMIDLGTGNNNKITVRSTNTETGKLAVGLGFNTYHSDVNSIKKRCSWLQRRFNVLKVNRSEVVWKLLDQAATGYLY